MVVIIFNIFVIIFDLLAAIIQYKNGNYIFAVILSFCVGSILSNTVWLIIRELEE